MKETYKDYFASRSAAARYAKGRPRFHALTVEKIKTFLGAEKSLGLSLDVGCGTGLSSAALKKISEKVIGIDVSTAMLEQTEKAAGLEYLAASAENLPFAGGEFDLITIAQAIHWIDREKFFAEAGRVLKPGAPLVAYDNYFQGKMVGNPAFGEWYKNEFLENYPVPPRGARTFAAESAGERDFVLVREELNDNLLEFSASELAAYLVTITNVIARVENGTQPIGEVYERLIEGLAPLFGKGREQLVFISPIWFLQRNN